MTLDLGFGNTRAAPAAQPTDLRDTSTARASTVGSLGGHGHVWVEDDVGAAIAQLGVVQGDVGPSQEPVERQCVVSGVDTGTGGHGHLVIVQPGRGDKAKRQFGDPLDHGGTDREEERELVASQADRDAASGGGNVLQAAGNGNQELVADFVSIAVVYGLEAVKIDENECLVPALPDQVYVGCRKTGAVG